jgi:hypothetical protein
VIREYVGSGFIGELAAQMDVEDRRRREEEGAAWKEEQERIRKLEEPIEELSESTDLLTKAVLLASGYHQHNRGEWRFRREPKEGRLRNQE